MRRDSIFYKLLVQIEDLYDVLLDFTNVADWEGWLQQQ
ncbi:DUF4351 domain-containing protein [Anabaena lutea]|nr:DUF4351 domain-containing protein [Anabaena lutea]